MSSPFLLQRIIAQTEADGAWTKRILTKSRERTKGRQGYMNIRISPPFNMETSTGDRFVNCPKLSICRKLYTQTMVWS